MNIKLYKEIRKLITGPGKDYIAGCLLDYDYIKNHCRLKAADLSKQKEFKSNSTNRIIKKMKMVQMLMEHNLSLY